mmetsp:Transcript_6734/g.16902  ORF Transcript_6734/g.16902 Transcript_6734/m.16902 type:complete len:720 (-) Transcript_6734:341-2500(-)
MPVSMCDMQVERGILAPLLFTLLLTSARACIPAEWEAEAKHADMLLMDGYFPSTPAGPTQQPSIGNGFAATVIDSDALFVSGLFNGEGRKTPSHRARIPSPLSLSLHHHGKEVEPCAAGLDLRRASFLRRSQVGGVSVVETFVTHRSLRHLLLYTVQAEGEVNNITVVMNRGSASDDLTVVQSGEEEGVFCEDSRIVQAETSTSPLENVTLCWPSLPTSLTLDSNTPFILPIGVSISIEGVDPHSTALATVVSASNRTLPDLLSSHYAEWEEIWSKSVTVESELYSNISRSVNASYYALYSSLRSDWPYSLSPGGIATNGYNGHTFWDCETWMFPSLLVQHRTLAESLLRYRQLRTSAAMDVAASYGYKGTMYPWESGLTGENVTPDWAQTGDFELHLEGDIALAVRQLLDTASQKDDKLEEEYYPLLKGIAEFWISKAEEGSDGMFDIFNVIPPDEDAGIVNNSVYTNAVAAESIFIAAKIAAAIGESFPAEYVDVAHHLRILLDNSSRRHLEYEGYEWEMEIKQADVTLLQYPLGWDMDDDIALNDLNYYQGVTKEGSVAMANSAYAILRCRHGQTEEAMQLYFDQLEWITLPFYVWHETPTGGNPNFITGAGGMMQHVVYGFGGVQIGEKQLCFQPSLPAAITSVRFGTATYKGIDMEVEERQSSIRAAYLSSDGSVTKLSVVSDSGEHSIDVSQLKAGDLIYEGSSSRVCIAPIG